MLNQVKPSTLSLHTQTPNAILTALTPKDYQLIYQMLIIIVLQMIVSQLTKIGLGLLFYNLNANSILVFNLSMEPQISRYKLCFLEKQC